MDSSTETVSSVAEKRPSRVAAVERPHVFVALHCDRPLLPTSRHSLADVDVVSIGRGRERAVTRSHDERLLAITVADPWMSGKHARLVRGAAGWLIEDAGSTNGTRVNGIVRKSALLADGDSVELGHTLFRYRERLHVGGDDPPDLDASQLRPAAPGLGTLCPSLAAQFARLDLIARSRVAVVISGETGCGKELAARAVHRLSGRSGPFVPVNCGAIPEALIESELFGHRKGAFSGAIEDRPGLIRSADGGTLFLDEIADLPAQGQAALLRALQEEEVLAVGSTKPVKVDMRLVAATHSDLKELTRRGAFRADLYARISGFTLPLPPLRERLEDFGLLVADILRKVAPDRCERIGFSCEAGRTLLRYSWPLNVRELEKCLAAAAALAADNRIELDHLPDDVRAPEAPQVQREQTGQPPRDVRLSEDEARHRETLVALLRDHGGNIAAVARTVGKARMQVQRWLKRYGLDPRTFRH